LGASRVPPFAREMAAVLADLCAMAAHRVTFRSAPPWRARQGPTPTDQGSDERYGYRQVVGGANVSLIARGDTQRTRFQSEPAWSFVPEARAPPNGCCPTTAPVGLSLM